MYGCTTTSMDLSLKWMCTHVWLCATSMYLNLCMCTYVWLCNNNSGLEALVHSPYLRPRGYAHMCCCGTAAMDLKLMRFAFCASMSMCTHVWLWNNSNGPEADVSCPYVRPCGCTHMYGCGTTAVYMKLKSLGHMCVYLDVLLSMAVQQQQWT